MSEHVERYVPGLQGEIWYEHWHRYHWARPLIAGLRVLDAACGEGYGSALLSQVAAQVTGVDIDRDVIAQARERYGKLPRLAFLDGDCGARLPLPEASVDAVVSFETIEHFKDQARFVEEVARVLAPGGLFLVSSPNQPGYNSPGSEPNPHHERELNEAEFRALLSPRFPAQRWFAQDVDFHSVIAPFGRAPQSGEVVNATNSKAATPADRVREAKYFLCACAREEPALERVGDRLTVLVDEEHFIRDDYRRMNAAMERWRLEREQLLARLEAMERGGPELEQLRAKLEAAERTIGRLAVERNRALLALPPAG